MADRKNKIVGDSDEALRQQKIVKQWHSFSKTEAFKDLMEYCEGQQEMLLTYAEELEMPGPLGKGRVPITGEMSNLLLQNRRGINIVKTYIRLRSE